MTNRNQKSSKNVKSPSKPTRTKDSKGTTRTSGGAGGRNFHVEYKNNAQKLAWNAFQQHDILFLIGPAGCGKALTLDAALYTKNGKISMKDAKIGMEIANPDGYFSKITGIYPQGKKQICRVHFSDNTYVDCCEEHLWSISHSDNGWKEKTVNTKYLEENCRRSDGKRVLSIRNTKPVDFCEKQYEIPPYLMGVLISEGGLTGSSPVFTTCEDEILKRVENLLNDDYVCKSSDGLGYRIVKEKRSPLINCYKENLKYLNLWGKHSYDKFIPSCYLTGSIIQRISLLQGLMDGDGGVEKTGSIVYSTTSLKLAEDLCQLIYSLGGSTKVNNKKESLLNGKRHRKSYRCYINLPIEIEMFFLERKKKLVRARSKYFPKRYVDRVERLGSTEMQCISVDHEDHLYLTDNFTVTHNTFLSTAFAVEQILNKQKKRIVLTRPVVEAGESMGFLPGPQPLDANILTPNGWVKMGEIKKGDYVIGRNGKPTKVIGIFPKGKKMVYKISTTENTSTECCLDHLWFTQTLRDRKVSNEGSVKTTKQIIETLFDKNGKLNHFIPRNEVVEFIKQNVPISPYALGALLGDGSISGDVRFINKDQEIIDRVSKELSEINCDLVKSKDNERIDYYIRGNCKVKKPARTIKLTSVENGASVQLSSVDNSYISLDLSKKNLAYRCRNESVVDGFKYEFLPLENRWSNPIKNIIFQLGLEGRTAIDKFIPDSYKFSSIEDRINILRGLMDTDGSVNKRNGEASFCTISKQLALDLIEVVRSLGGRAKLRIRDRVGKKSNLKNRTITSKHISYEFTISLPNINPFFLKRKADLYKCNNIHKIGIASIEEVCVKDVQCILVDNPEHLYLTDQYIVTHNTAQDKIDPYMLPLYDCLDKMVGREGPWFDRVDEAVEVAPLAFMRGRSTSCNNSFVLTPNGFVKMGDIKKGDFAIGRSGKPIEVLNIYPQGKLPVYKVKFSDHTEIICSGDHLWSTMTINEKNAGKDFSVKTTLEIKETLKNKYNAKNHRIPILENPVEFESKEVLIDPYLLGCLLGDGHIGKDCVRISSIDEEILSECENRLPLGIVMKFRKGCDYAFSREFKENENTLLNNLNELKLLGSKSNNKFIPDVYKVNSTEIRLEILRGLLDTDGCIFNHRSGNSRIQYYSTSKRLAEDVMFLVRSLGGTAYCRKREFDESDSHVYKDHVIRHTCPSYVVDILISINPFKLKRKYDKFKNNSKSFKLISSIEYFGEDDCQCISVDAQDSLYLTDDFIVTHNTFEDAICILDEAQNATMAQLKLFLTRFDSTSKVLITGDPAQSDLPGKNALVETMQRLRGLDGVGVVEFKNNSIVRHPLIGKIIDRLEAK